jgi:hypothetical protein
VVVTTKRSKTAQQPLKATHSATFKKNARKMLRAVGKEVASYRADLKVGQGGGVQGPGWRVDREGGTRRGGRGGTGIPTAGNSACQGQAAQHCVV